MSSYRFSFDLGTNSIGWAVIELETNLRPNGLVDCGSRIFSDGRNPKDKQSLAVARREARAMRRRRDRYLKRRNELTYRLIAHGLMPQNADDRKSLVDLDPYALRAKALDEQIPLYHFGRALFHLNQRRGFKSNRKTDRGSTETGITKVGMKKLQESLASEGCRTLGELQHRHHQANQSPTADTNPQSVRAKLRGEGAKAAYDFYPSRDAVEDEFNQLWQSQKRFHPETLTDEACESIRDAIFFQRKLKIPKVGKCTLNPAEERHARAMPITQRFRILQFIGDLRLIDGDLRKHPLAPDQRDALYREFLAKNKVTFKRMRVVLKAGPEMTFSHETEKQTEIKGDETAAILAGPKYFGPAWRELPLNDQSEIVEKLIHEQDEETLIDFLHSRFGFNREKCEAIADAPIPDGYARLGKTALHTLVAIMEEDDLSYDQACKNAGYDHALLPDGEILPELPYYGIALERHVAFGDGESDNIEQRIGKIANPTVHIALNQLRKVMNALIALYGHPDQVVLEIARDLKNSRSRKDDIVKQQKTNQDANDRRRKDLLTTDTSINAENMLRMRLWEELNPNNPLERACPFTGEQISRERLFSSNVEIEHILPFSRSLDNSPANKTLCMTWANRAKGNRTPWEAFCRDGEKGYVWDDILARAANLPKNKSWRFAPDAMERLERDGDFLDRQLIDTQYLSRIAREYVSKVCDPNQVWITPGRLTAWLRRNWGLESILSTSNATKNRDDHRHHAIDAIVVGVTDRGILNRISRAAAIAETEELDRIIAEMPEPFDNFREQVRSKVEKIIVSHKPDTGYTPGRKNGDATPGKLHDEMPYGQITLPENGTATYVKRVPLISLGAIKKDKKTGGITFPRINEIVDKEVRQILIEKLEKIPNPIQKDVNNILSEYCETSGTRRIRICFRENPHPIFDKYGKAYKYVKTNGNLYSDIFQKPDGKWGDEAVSTFKAMQSGFVSEWKKTYPTACKIMRLHINDMIAIDHIGKREICRVVKTTKGNITLALHHEANLDKRAKDPDDPFKYIFCAAESLRKRNAQKLYVDTLGKLRGHIPEDG